MGLSNANYKTGPEPCLRLISWIRGFFKETNM